jgi:integrase
MRGMGRIFLRGCTWWIAYMADGREVRESSRSTRRAEARALLKRRLGELVGGRWVAPERRRVGFDDLAALIVRDYEANRRRSLPALKRRLKYLRRAFGWMGAGEITAERVRRYVNDRLAQGAANATVNRELAALRRMLRLGHIAGRVGAPPVITLLREDNARQGFVGPTEFAAIRRWLPDYLRDPVTFLYWSAWRPSEMRTLEWRDVELEAGVIRLRPERSKNYAGRVLPIVGELRAVIERAMSRRAPGTPYVFHRRGRPLGRFDATWRRAAAQAGMAGILTYDLRRSAVRNLVRAGVPERVAMEISGHKTRRVFDRYNIVSEADLRAGLSALAAYLARPPAAWPLENGARAPRAETIPQRRAPH